MSDKVSFEELDRRLDQCPEPMMGIWKHYKGGEYVVVGSAIGESDQLPYVIYRPIGNQTVFCRPLWEWNEKFTLRDQQHE